MNCLKKLRSKPEENFIANQKKNFLIRLFFDLTLFPIFIFLTLMAADSELKSSSNLMLPFFVFVFVALISRGVPIIFSFFYLKQARMVWIELFLVVISIVVFLVFLKNQGLQNSWVWIIFGIFQQVSNALCDKLNWTNHPA